MYSGHNCTNYAAYRMVHSGLPNERPWSGGGNAEYWGLYNKEITDDVPKVGAVAWWAENVRPAGSAGHVAYVEKVISEDEIIVSQDSWGGDFSWARITRAGGSWPSGFVHFNDVSFDNTAKPTVSGDTKVGGVLTATTGSWSPASTDTTYSYAWKAGGEPITRATKATLTLRADEKGKRIQVAVTASRAGFPAATAVSTKTPVVESGVLSSTVAPVLSGEATVDQVLSVTAGTWDPASPSLAYQWLRDGAPIDGATATTYSPTPDDVDHVLTVRVTASRAGYDDVAVVTAPTDPVALADFVVKHAPTLTGSPRLGESLTLDPGSWSPATDATATITWFRGGLPVEGVTGTTYVLGPEDLGQRIAASVTVTRAGYTPLVQPTAATTLVKSRPTIRVRSTHPGHGRLDLVLRLAADGVDVVSGTVQVLSHGVVLKEVPVRTGTRNFALRHLEPGPMKLRFRYAGSSTLTGATLTKMVRVR
nr:CHAP domain-containing protein [Nocardioides luti]